MDWKETVMEEQEMVDLLCYIKFTPAFADELKKVAKKQAQITGDIAYEAGEKAMYDKISKALGLTGINDAAEIAERLRREGRQEVMMNSHDPFTIRV